MSSDDSKKSNDAVASTTTSAAVPVASSTPNHLRFPSTGLSGSPIFLDGTSTGEGVGQLPPSIPNPKNSFDPEDYKDSTPQPESPPKSLLPPAGLSINHPDFKHPLGDSTSGGLHTFTAPPLSTKPEDPADSPPTGAAANFRPNTGMSAASSASILDGSSFAFDSPKSEKNP